MREISVAGAAQKCTFSVSRCSSLSLGAGSGSPRFYRRSPWDCRVGAAREKWEPGKMDRCSGPDELRAQWRDAPGGMHDPSCPIFLRMRVQAWPVSRDGDKKMRREWSLGGWWMEYYGERDFSRVKLWWKLQGFRMDFTVTLLYNFPGSQCVRRLPWN